MSDLIGICGQVRGLEPRLLDKNRLDRMVGATNADEAFKVLSELQYAEYLDQETTLADFDQIITQGLFETKEVLSAGSNDHPGMQFLWLKFDINNLARALKQKLIEGKSNLENFADDKSFSSLGDLTEADIQRIVFERKPSGPLPFQVLEVVMEAENTWNKTKEFRDIEFGLDQAYFNHLNLLVTESGDDFLAEFFDFMVNLIQVRNVARCVLVMKEPIPEHGHLPFGHFNAEKVAKITNIDDLVKMVKPTEFNIITKRILDQDSPTQKMLKIEQNLDELYNYFLSSRAVGSIDGVAILLNYFEQRLQNARLIKLVMYGKMNGLTAEQIYDLIENN